MTDGPVPRRSDVSIGGENLCGILRDLTCVMDMSEVLFGEVFFRCESVLQPPEGLTQVALVRFFPFHNFVNPIVSPEGE
jgi:hypothetical protein